MQLKSRIISYSSVLISLKYNVKRIIAGFDTETMVYKHCLCKRGNFFSLVFTFFYFSVLIYILDVAGIMSFIQSHVHALICILKPATLCRRTLESNTGLEHVHCHSKSVLIGTITSPLQSSSYLENTIWDQSRFDKQTLACLCRISWCSFSLKNEYISVLKVFFQQKHWLREELATFDHFFSFL
jgi:hypothetical protein